MPYLDDTAPSCRSITNRRVKGALNIVPRLASSDACLCPLPSSFQQKRADWLMEVPIHQLAPYAVRAGLDAAAAAMNLPELAELAGPDLLPPLELEVRWEARKGAGPRERGSRHRE